MTLVDHVMITHEQHPYRHPLEAQEGTRPTLKHASEAALSLAPGCAQSCLLIAASTAIANANAYDTRSSSFARVPATAEPWLEHNCAWRHAPWEASKCVRQCLKQSMTT